MDGIFFVVDTTDKDRLPIVAEVLEEMARHPGLGGRDIPFLILGNKSDCEDSVDEKELTKFLQLDKLKSLNECKYQVRNIIAINGDGVKDCFKYFAKSKA